MRIVYLSLLFLLSSCADNGVTNPGDATNANGKLGEPSVDSSPNKGSTPGFGTPLRFDVLAPKYPFPSVDYELTHCNPDLVLALNDQEKEKEKDLYKVLLLNRNVYEYTVTAFMIDFTKGLKAKGWHIVDAQHIKNSLKDDLSKITGIERYPDIVAIYNAEANLFKNWDELFQKEMRKSVLINWTDEVHSDAIIDGLRTSLEFTDAVFARYPLATLQVLKPHNPRCFSIPHAATHNFFKDIRYDKTETVLLSGQSLWPFYPLREEALRLLNAGNKLITQRKHPGYGYNPNPEEETKAYADEISKHLLAISGGSLTPGVPAPFVLAKHFEIPAAGTALITDEELVPYLREYGFISGQHYIATSRENLSETIKYWLDPQKRDELMKITKRGQDLVRRYHRNDQRIDAFDRIAVNLFHLKNAGK